MHEGLSLQEKCHLVVRHKKVSKTMPWLFRSRHPITLVYLDQRYVNYSLITKVQR